MIAQASPAAGPLKNEPQKRVNYTLGLVLGVDEFQQDQLYHAAARRGHNRLLHGYGTVWGLGVTAASGGADPEIQVAPGVALDPCGREICVPSLMCVKLTAWLQRHRATLQGFYPDPTDQPIPLSVILCHRECPTDVVPVPGEPCRSQDDAMQPSRIRESFELKLALRDEAPWGSPPSGNPTGVAIHRTSQPEEQAVRAFGLLLARVQTTTDEALDDTGKEELFAGVRALEHAASEATLSSPPEENDDPILLPADSAAEILREAFGIWVTEVRPKIRALESPDLCGDPSDECCVLLADLDLEVTGDWGVAAGEIPIDQERRPYLLHTRLLQEWLIAGGGEEGRPDVDSWASLEILGPRRVRIWIHHDEWLHLPREAVELVLNDTTLPEAALTELPFAGIRNVWDAVLAQELSDGDVLEVRVDTDQLALVEPPPPGVVDELRDLMETDEALHRILYDLAGRVGDRVLLRELEQEAVRLDRLRLFAIDARTIDARTIDTRTIDARIRLTRRPDRERELLARLYRGGEGESRVIDEEALGEIVREIQERRAGWTPAASTQTGTVGAELRGPTGEYLDRHGFRLSAYTVYDRIEGGDLEGEYKLPVVAKIQKVPVDSARPLADQYLVSDGAKWLPRHLPDGTVDLAGRYPDSTVVGIQGRSVSDATPENDQYLRWDGTQWVPAFLPDGTQDLSGRYPDNFVVGLQGVPVSNATPGPEHYLRFDVVTQQWIPANLPDAQGDLAGRYPQLTIARLQGEEVAAANPGSNEVLVYNGAQWVPGSVRTLLGAADGDVTGLYHTLNVVRLRGRAISTNAPADGQALVFRESSPPGNGQWVPATLSTGGGSPTGPAGGDLVGSTYPAPIISHLQTIPVLARRPSSGDVLTFDGAAWVPSQGGGGATAYEVIAAGTYFVGEQDAQPTAPPFNGLTLAPLGPFVYELVDFPFEPDEFVYVVKGTSELGVVLLFRTDRLAIRILTLPETDLKEGELHVEISRYPIKQG